MAQINVTQFAQQLGLPTGLLMEQLQAAGVNKALSEDTPLTEKDKTQLLEHLRKSHGAGEAKQKITLTRRQTTEIKKSDSLGKSRTIQIEVRKKRVLVKRDAAEPETAPESARPVLDAEQIAMREAESRQQAELAARQAEDAENYEEGDLLRDIATPEAELHTKQIAQAVNEAVDALPEELRTAITLREIEGMSYEDIAQMMECPIGTVRSRIFRAREAIAERIRPMLGTGQDKRW